MLPKAISLASALIAGTVVESRPEPAPFVSASSKHVVPAGTFRRYKWQPPARVLAVRSDALLRKATDWPLEETTGELQKAAAGNTLLVFALTSVFVPV